MWRLPTATNSPEAVRIQVNGPREANLQHRDPCAADDDLQPAGCADTPVSEPMLRNAPTRTRHELRINRLLGHSARQVSKSAMHASLVFGTEGQHPRACQSGCVAAGIRICDVSPGTTDAATCLPREGTASGLQTQTSIHVMPERERFRPLSSSRFWATSGVADGAQREP